MSEKIEFQTIVRQYRRITLPEGVNEGDAVKITVEKLVLAKKS